MTGAIVVTEVAQVDGCDVPVEALVFHPGGELVIYSRLLVPAASLTRLSASISLDDLFYDAVLN